MCRCVTWAENLTVRSSKSGPGHSSLRAPHPPTAPPTCCGAPQLALWPPACAVLMLLRPFALRLVLQQPYKQRMPHYLQRPPPWSHNPVGNCLRPPSQLSRVARRSEEGPEYLGVERFEDFWREAGGISAAELAKEGFGCGEKPFRLRDLHAKPSASEACWRLLSNLPQCTAMFLCLMPCCQV